MGVRVVVSQQMIIHFSMEMGMQYNESGTGLFAHTGIISAITRAEFTSYKMSYVTLTICWCDITILNVHEQTGDKSDMADSLSNQRESALDQFPKMRMKILFGDFNAKVETEGIFKSTIGNYSLHEISNDDGVRVLNLATSKTLSRVQCSVTTFINTLALPLMEIQAD
jgi:hypothetical protein